MIPQLVVTAWLTLTCVIIGISFYKASNEEEGGVVIAILYIVVPIVALYHAGFWAIK